MSARLIVNADDYGHTAGVSAGIRAAHLHGMVTSTSAMMNRPNAVQALPLAIQTCPQLGLGLHLVLTSGRPLLPAGKLASLVQPDGRFFSQDGFIARLEQIDLNEVQAEWHAQVELFTRTTGRLPDHLDSHHHASYFTPGLFECMLLLAEECHCPIRKPFGVDSASMADYLPFEMDGAAQNEIHSLIDRYTPITTDRFTDRFYDQGVSRSNLLAILAEIAVEANHKTVELMCHPAVVDEELRAVSSYNDNRAHELALLQDPEVLSHLQTLGIKLIHYGQI
ncbi:MAG TPA: ChbG/HpnK family deacetylase [Longilinea sp.]|nr:ChbG/HpnK family deacetylase [Longilinea sp.]